MMNRKKATVFLCILLAVILVSSFFASMIQADGFSTQITELKGASNSGVLYDEAGLPTKTAVDGAVVSGMLFVPENATKEQPAPGILLSHGYLNNYQLQLQNAIELSRRGYVVLCVDIEGHGGNNNVSNYAAGNEAWNDNNGLYDAVKYLYNLDCVDKSMIGCSAHSMGAESLAVVLALDGEHYQQVCDANADLRPEGKGLGLIKAVIWQGFDPILSNVADAEFNNLQGTIDFNLFDTDTCLGILKASNDEFFYTSTRPDGTPTTCPEYLESVNAAVFTRTGYTEGDNASVQVEDGVFYVNGAPTKAADGKALGCGFSVIFEDENEIHPLNHFSTQAAGNMVRFFYAAFGTPTGAEFISPDSQTWWIKETCSFIGLVCFFLLLVPVPVLLLDIPFFSSLKLKSTEVIDAHLDELKGVRKHLTYWLSALAVIAFSNLTYTKLYSLGSTVFTTSYTFPQDTTNPLLFWAARVGFFTFAVILVGYIINTIINRKKYGKDFAEHEYDPFTACKIDGGLASFLKTLVLALAVVVSVYAVVFAIYAIFRVDFRIWHFDVKTFDIAVLSPVIIRYLPLFFIFYGVNAFANTTYRVKNLSEPASIAINAVANTLGVALYLIYDYVNLMATGSIPAGVHPLAAIIIMPMLGLLPICTVNSRLLYKRTGNIWLGAFVNTMIVTIFTVANTAASWAYVIV